jgi:hypothetical protein
MATSLSLSCAISHNCESLAQDAGLNQCRRGGVLPLYVHQGLGVGVMEILSSRRLFLVAGGCSAAMSPVVLQSRFPQLQIQACDVPALQMSLRP